VRFPGDGGELTRRKGGSAAKRSRGTDRPPGTNLAGPGPFEILEIEHERLRVEIGRAVTAAADRPSSVRDAVLRLRALARRHAAREERVLYPVCERLFGPYGAVAVMRADHVAIDAALSAMTRWTGEGSTAPFERFVYPLEMHLGREERVLFPIMACLLSGAETNRLARQLRTNPEPPRIGTRRYRC